ncbi:MULTISPECIES: LysR family transcriptional regulator [Pseudomonas aeruginosa group]|uniref:LysR family transcriptional regulator n=1 Tax=Pseudomonas aeruginosa group TaxID=136841 RepID=UPI001E3F17BE
MFVTVARARSFTRAAATMRTRQPALSLAVRELEKRLGVELLVRTPQGVSPTQAGQRLLVRLAPEFYEIEGDQQLQVRVPGSWMFNGSYPSLDEVLAGVGLMYLPEPLVRARMEEGRLLPLLKKPVANRPGFAYLFCEAAPLPTCALFDY